MNAKNSKSEEIMIFAWLGLVHKVRSLDWAIRRRNSEFSQYPVDTHITLAPKLMKH
ncbi:MULTISPECIES: hypothetical protein [unclassified Nostoc]|uniref:hypothetical protein n=1 Tax=unclassified Nostoc TaxID=2593658 RepID=UPI002AD416B0|nr:hypothetical protein [Nostoc sp. ChiQUE02]MDZ8234638.1 hypothetical protein [Nostoc sp. ChiQUE02]